MSETKRDSAVASSGLAYSLLIIASAVSWLNSGFWRHWDLPVYDGVYYFQKAQAWPMDQLTLNREWSPLYVIFYSLFHRLPGNLDPFWIYAIHRLVVTSLTVFLFWWICVRLLNWRQGTPLALIMAANGTLLANFHVVHTAGLAFVLLTLAATMREADDPWLPASMSLAGVFVRPELLWSFAMILLWQAYDLWRGGSRLRIPSLKSGIWLTLVLVLWLTTTPPSGPSRAFEAFSQQGAWAAARGISVSAGFQHHERTGRIYGDAKSLAEAFWVNPGAFTQTILSNGLELPKTVLLSAAPTPRDPGLLGTLLTVLLFYVVAMSCAARWRPDPQFWVALLAFACTGIAVSLIMHPTRLYLLPLLPAIWLGLPWLLGRSRREVSARRLSVLWVGAVGAVVVASFASSPQGQPIRHFSGIIADRQSADQPARVLAYSSASYCLYAQQKGMACEGIEPSVLQNPDRLQALLQENRASFVVVDAALRQFAHELNRTELFDFETHPERYGFKLVQTREGGLMAELLRELPVEKSSRLYQRTGP